MFRAPSPPGSVGTIESRMAEGLEKWLGRHDGGVVPGTRTHRFKFVLIVCVVDPKDVRKKLVGKLKPFPGLSGNPVWKRSVPVHCQPPITASLIRPELAPSFLPLPNGRSATQKPFTLCRRSKSDGARLARKSNGFRSEERRVGKE